VAKSQRSEQTSSLEMQGKREMKRVVSLFLDDRGTSSVEYAAIASIISIAAIGAMAAVGAGVLSLFGSVPGF